MKKVKLFNDNPNELDYLCEKYGSDKGFVSFDNDKPYWWKPHCYTTFYHSIFSHCREYITSVFECGLDTNNEDVESNMSSTGRPGASLRMWRDYFPNADIFGADVDERILFNEYRIKTYFVDQLNKKTIQSMWGELPNIKFDIIIDDGLHTKEAGIGLFNNSFHMLRGGGIYIIEDVKREYLSELMDELRNHNIEVIEFSVDGYFNPIDDDNIIVIRKN